MSNNFAPPEWASNSNIYEVNIRQYTPEGTFHAFAKHLPRLKDMGVKILWLMPVTPISIEKRQGTLGSYYACSSYTSINPEFGSENDFRELIQLVHESDMKIIIDWVANHTGWDHVWVKEHPDWYRKDSAGNFTEENNWEDVIDLDYSKIPMQNGMIAAMKYWIEKYNIDGFRCDMAHLVPLDFWRHARNLCDAIKPLFWLAESDVNEYSQVFDVSYAWHWMHVTEQVFKNSATLQQLKEVLLNTPVDVKKLYFTTNHDENSWNGTEYEKYNGGALMMAVFACTWIGMPLIYSGQELPNYKRLRFFEKDNIDWEGSEPLLHKFYRSLLMLRNGNSALGLDSSAIILETNANENVLTYILENNEDAVLVMLNLSDHNRIKVEIENRSLAGRYTNIFSGLKYTFEENETFELQAWEYFVYAKAITSL